MKKTNVAASAASFVGRAPDLEGLVQLFDEGARLVTLLGPGGMGKTRTALRFVEEHGDTLADAGTWLCDLAAARTSADACIVIAAALRVPLARGAEELCAALARRGRVLLVLDDFESVHPEATSLVSALLEAAPRATFLVTSRVALGIAGEHLWPLEPLAAEDAATLFIERARQVRPGFAPSDVDRAAILEIARRVDGIPLAIELAAARAGVLSPAQIAARLSPELLARGGAGRHTSMRLTIADSLAMLDDAERACLASASVFRGGFTLEAAEAVVGGERVLPHLDALRSRSLLVTRADPDGALRFVIYEPIREVVAEEVVDDEALRRRHLAFFAARGRLLSSQRDQRATALDLDNLLLGHASAIAFDIADAAIDLALAVDPILRARGHSGARLRVLDEALACQSTHDARFAEALVARGETHRQRGTLDAARRDFDDALAIAESAGAKNIAAHARVGIGELVEAQGRTAEARTWLEAAIAESTGTALASARTHLAHALRREGRLDAAEREAAQAMVLYREVGDEEGLARAVFESGVIALFSERHERARAMFEEACELARRVGARELEASTLTATGTLLQERGEIEEAIVRHRDALAIFRDTNDPYSEGSTLYYLAGATLEHGQPADATTIASRALRVLEGLASHRYEALLRGLLATIDAQEGRLEAARALLAAAQRATASCPTEPSLEATIAIHALAIDRPADAVARARALASAHPCDDPRFALRLLARTKASDAAAIVIRRGALTVLVPAQTDAIDLSRRAPLRRIMAVLAERRRDAPGEPLSLDDLIAAGWPGERIGRAAGVNRAHVALAELRKLGLRDVLVSGERGYALVTSCGIVIEPD